MSSDRSTARGDHFEHILEMFNVCLCGCVLSLSAVVVPFQSFVDCMGKVLLTLEVERNTLEGIEQLESVTAVRDILEILGCLNLLPHDIAALSPYEGIQDLDVGVELGKSLHVLVNSLLPRNSNLRFSRIISMVFRW